MNRNDLKQVAAHRLREAQVLLKNAEFSGAYYLAGYAVECGLKACIARQTRQHDFPDRETVNASYTHNLESLARTAGLAQHLGAERRLDPAFELNWAITKDWRESSRYAIATKDQAESLYAAITHRRHGIMRWLRQYW